MRPRLLRKRYFVWLVVPLALYLGYLDQGLPHLRFSYSWRDNGQGYSLNAYRHYTHCVFVGPFGRFDFYPHDGRCPWVRFYQRKGTVNAR